MSTPVFEVQDELFVKHPKNERRIKVWINRRELGNNNWGLGRIYRGWIYGIRSDENEQFFPLTEKELLELSEIYCDKCGSKLNKE